MVRLKEEAESTATSSEPAEAKEADSTADSAAEIADASDEALETERSGSSAGDSDDSDDEAESATSGDDAPGDDASSDDASGDEAPGDEASGDELRASAETPSSPVIELPERPARTAPPPSKTSGSGARVAVEHLTKSFRHGGRRLEVLHSVSFNLDPGEMVAIVGKSGVGKSTLLHVLGTLDLPTSGSLQINGEEITRMGPARLAEFRNREIGFVFQFHHLLPEFTALENVMMPCLINRLSRRAAADAAREVLDAVGLSTRLTHKPGELSGGEQQRVALARAMVMRPSLLLADEPTGNLDSNTGASIHELFLRLNEERGSTTLIVTHNPELAALMPRCLRMVDGGLEDERA